MDNFIKITTGWVRQHYERNEAGVFVCTGQEFNVGDLHEYEDDGGQPIDPPECEYQPYDMIQPKQEDREQALLDAAKEILSDFNRYGEVLQVGDNGEYGTESAIGRLHTAIYGFDHENKVFCESCGRHNCEDVKWREQTRQYECEECYQEWLDC